MQKTKMRLEWRPVSPLVDWIILTVLMALPVTLWPQAIAITLDQAFEVASRNYPLLKQDRQFIEQQNALIRSAASRPYTAIFISGDEVDPQSTQGIHSLGIRQDLNWPGTRAGKEEVIRQQALLGNARLELDQMELRQQVALAYYEVLYVRGMQDLARQKVGLFNDLLELANLRFDLGETGKIPVLSAEGMQKEATLEQIRINEDYKIALTIFNNWMYSDTSYDVAARALPEPAGYFNWFVNTGHPFLLFQQQEANLARARVEAEQDRLLPQIRTAGLLQMVDGDSPFFGYQLGLNIPLGVGAIRSRIEGAKVQTEISETGIEVARSQLDNERRRLIRTLEKEQAALDYIRKEMLPLAQEQIDDSRKAYAQGAVEYQDYLRNLQQALDTRLQYLQGLKRYNLLRLELEFLSGRR